MTDKVFETAKEVDIFQNLSKWEKLIANISAWGQIILHRIKRNKELNHDR